MFNSIARSLFGAYKRRGATATATWHPSSGDPVCAGDVVRSVMQGETAFSGKPIRHDVIEYLSSDFPGLDEGETITINGTDLIVREIHANDGTIARAIIGAQDGKACK